MLQEINENRYIVRQMDGARPRRAQDERRLARPPKSRMVS